MRAAQPFAETRELSGFDRVLLQAQHEHELTITQGDGESLHIEAPREVLSRIKAEVNEGTLVIGLAGSLGAKIRDALSTSLTRLRVKYHLRVKDLRRLEIFGLARVHASELATDHLSIRFQGVGEVKVDALEAKLLEVDLSGPSRIELAGRVGEQKITLSGPGLYHAPNLESREARVIVNGIGSALVWAIEGLEATIRGTGNVSYYGRPSVRETISPLGSLVHLGDPRPSRLVPQGL